MPEGESLEGWMPALSEELTLERVIDLAFDYRGNVTIVKQDGAEIAGYVFNRDTSAPRPFIQFFDEKGNGPFKLLYSEVANIKFTGKDTAAGMSWDAWVARKEKERVEQAARESATEASG